MGGSKKLFFFIGLNWTFANTFYFTENFLKTIPNAVHQGKSGAAVPSTPPLNPPMINLKNGLLLAPTCIPSKEVFSDFVNYK